MFTEKDTTRFWSHVDKRGPDECWLHNLDGHTIGCYQHGKRTNYSLRKFAWASERNEMLPDDVSLMETCGNARCVNPAHMQVLKRGTKKIDLPGIFYLAYRAGFDLQELPNGRYRVVRRGAG